MSYLEINNLRLSQGAFELRADLSLEKGRTGILLGPSGCGKTTLLRCIAGLERHSAGTISIDGRRIDAMPPEARDIGYIFQNLALFEHMSTRRNIAFGLRIRKAAADQADARVAELSDKLGISHLLDRRPAHMSGGERQRLAFARSLAVPPKLMLLDEPLSSLDASLRRSLRTYLRDFSRTEGVTSLHVTHDVEEAFELGDAVFLMRDGRIVASGRPEDLHDSPPNRWTAMFLGLGSLIRIGRVRNDGGSPLAETPIGTFSCKAGSATAFGNILDGAEASFFYPRKAPVQFEGASESMAASVSRGSAGVDRFYGKLMRITYQGDFWRLAVRPSVQHWQGTGPALAGRETAELEFDVAARPSLAPGDFVVVRLNPDSGLLLTD